MFFQGPFRMTPSIGIIEYRYSTEMQRWTYTTSKSGVQRTINPQQRMFPRLVCRISASSPTELLNEISMHVTVWEFDCGGYFDWYGISVKSNRKQKLNFEWERREKWIISDGNHWIDPNFPSDCTVNFPMIKRWEQNWLIRHSWWPLLVRSMKENSCTALQLLLCLLIKTFSISAGFLRAPKT